MYAVTNSLKLERFHGATLVQICIGEFQQQFHFIDPELHLSIEYESLSIQPGDIFV